ncbi:hypothetical protein ACHAXS_007318 [Conticribra weissflogii]
MQELVPVQAPSPTSPLPEHALSGMHPSMYVGVNVSRTMEVIRAARWICASEIGTGAVVSKCCGFATAVIESVSIDNANSRATQSVDKIFGVEI